MLNPTFNNSSVISWRSVLLVEETGVPVEKYMFNKQTIKKSAQIHSLPRKKTTYYFKNESCVHNGHLEPCEKFTPLYKKISYQISSYY